MSDFRILVGDCRAHMPPLDPVDAIVADPPYELGLMGKRWDRAGVAFDPATWRACFDVLKDGGRMLAFGGSRTHHRIWCAIEDAGFVIEDTMMWLYGSGFPKHRSKLKPAYEPICVARKGGVSDLNIDAARIPTTDNLNGGAYAKNASDRPDNYEAWRFKRGDKGNAGEFVQPAGRWPANVALDEGAAAVLNEQSASASRFLYVAKAARCEREHGLEGVPVHPTVKPVDLMRWLVRLVALPGQTVLDPFMGSGSTGVAAIQEGRRFVGIELDPDYAEIARRRIGDAQPSLFAEGV